VTAVLLVCLEESLTDPVRRAVAFGADPANVDIVTSLPNGVADLRAIMARRIYAAVFMDTLAALLASLGVSDFNAAAQVLPVMNELATLAHESGAAIVLLHHASKGTGKYRDSTALGGAVDLIVEMADPEDAGDPTRRDFKTRGRMPTENFSVTFADGRYAPAESGESLEMRIIRAIRDAAANGRTLSKTAIREAIGGRVARIDAALRALTESRAILYDRADGYTLPALALVADEPTGPEW
jgi:hypothetical protein